MNNKAKLNTLKRFKTIMNVILKSDKAEFFKWYKEFNNKKKNT